MILAQEDAALFFKLMWAVQFYVNNRLKLVPKVASVEVYQQLSQVKTSFNQFLTALDRAEWE
ncbi:MAG TPA: hypothetical protein VEC93_16130 [Anaerolineae bacterium]|nr:hypothetical protein [Anaerolineae bacterium]